MRVGLVQCVVVAALAAVASASFVETYAPLYALQDPAGTYQGTKSVLGQQVKATMVIKTASALQFTVSGPVSIDCDNEKYVYEASSGLISFPNGNTKGDCVHDALAQYKATLQSIKYDAAADHITISLKVSIVGVQLELDHVSQTEVLRHADAVFARLPASDEPLDALVGRMAARVAGSSPSGTYTGSKSVMGNPVDALVEVTATHFSVVVSNAVALECDDELYTNANGVLTITNLNKTGDCIHDQMAAFACVLQNITYDAVADSIVVTAKVRNFFVMTYVLDKATTTTTTTTNNNNANNAVAATAIAAATTVATTAATTAATTTEFGALVERYLGLELLTDPKGTYKGSKSVLGQNVDCVVSVDSTTVFDIALSGALAVSCSGEPYVFSDGVITPTKINDDGDCLHDALAKNAITLESITYDSATDEITVNVKYSIFKIALVLQHTSSAASSAVVVRAGVSPAVPVLPSLFAEFYRVFLLQDPSGVYEGSKTVLGQKLDATMDVKSAASLIDFTVIGLVKVQCPNEAYTYANGVVSLTDLSKKGDCVHDTLADKGATLQSLTYDSTSDVITAKFSMSFLTISVDLTHKA